MFDPVHLVEVVVGGEAVLQRVTQLQRVAEDEVLVFDKPPYAATKQVTSAEVEHLRRGVRARVIYDRTALETPGQLATLRDLASLGEQARLLDHVPTKMMIADCRLGVVPLGADDAGADGIVVIHSSPLLDALVALFESLWRVAMPMAVGSRSPRSRTIGAADAELLTLLAAGLKDEAIGHQLGLSRRTVQRRIRQLMDRLGAQSRAQTVLQAVRRGLLPEAEQQGRG